MPKKRPDQKSPVKISLKSKQYRVVLGSIVDNRAASLLLDAMRKVAGREHPIVVDAGAVERISTPCIQILLSAARTLESSGRRLAVGAASNAFVDAFSALGLFPTLMNWQSEQ